jgi:transcriptional repressor NrdR
MAMRPKIPPRGHSRAEEIMSGGWRMRVSDWRIRGGLTERDAQLDHNMLSLPLDNLYMLCQNPAMRCPYCTSQDTRVIDSREADDGIRRRRECVSCGERFTTYERPQVTGMLVVKKDGRREEYTREKLLLGIRKACEKRPLAMGTLEAVVDEIEAVLNEQGLAEVSSRDIGEMVMGHLRQLDQIAYIRFASVYRQFADLDDLKDELDELETAAVGMAEGKNQPPLIPEEELLGLARPPAWRALHDGKGAARSRSRQRRAVSAAAGEAKGSASPSARRGGPR